MSIRMLLGAVFALTAAGCATYEPHRIVEGGRAFFLRRFLGTTTLIYCDATTGWLKCSDTTDPGVGPAQPAPPAPATTSGR